MRIQTSLFVIVHIFLRCGYVGYTQYLIQAPLISNTFETGQNLGKIKQSTGAF